MVPADGRIVTVGDPRGAGGRAHRGERAGPEGRLGGQRRGHRARRPHQHGLPEHPGHPRHGDVRGHRDRRDDPDGPHRGHGHRDQARQVAAAARARRPDQGVRRHRLGGRGRSSRSSASRAARTSETLILLCISTAISAIPVGLPTFVQTMLSSGAQRLAEAKAVVKSLTDVETLGGTTVINSDKTGTLTMNAMTATTMLTGGDWFTIEGGGYQKTGAILGVGGRRAAGLRAPRARTDACAPTRRSATTGRSSAIPPRRRSSSWPPRSASAPRRRGGRSRGGRRCRSTPSTSSWRRSTTGRDVARGGVLQQPHFMTVKGAPDVVIDRCGSALWHGQAGADREGPRRAARRQPAAVREGSAGARVRRARPRRRGDGRGRAPTRWQRSRTWCWSRSSGSSTRCAPRPSERCGSRWTPASTSA